MTILKSRNADAVVPGWQHASLLQRALPELQFVNSEAHTRAVNFPACLVGVDLVLGGMNLHQDIHFSTFYLRASLSSNTGSDYPGYSFVLGVYEDGVERYYISGAEAEQTAKWLIRRSVTEPEWLREQLAKIETHSKKLAEAFPDRMNPASLQIATTAELVELYVGHNRLHRALYRFARLPEALDRGSPFFSEYLRGYLRDKGVPDADLPMVFEKLTAPQIPSVIAEEDRAFNTIVSETLACWPDLLAAHTPEMFLPAEVREALRVHREQWGWLCYHGYRDRARPSEEVYVRRLLDSMTIPAEVPRTGQAGTVRSAPLPTGIDPQHTELFRLYSEIGRVKLLRRLWQLRNFYFLDQLLAEFARRLHATEWEVRCCLPEELLSALRHGQIDPAVGKRSRRCAVLYTGDGEFILHGDDVGALLRNVHVRKGSQDGSSARRGTPACVGFARGKVRVVGQSRDQHRAFQKGEVLVCEAADPDFLPMIRRACAVVTQQGGVTSHASVLCREIGVPTLIGVEDLLGFVNDGDEVEVDARIGVIRAIGRDNEPTEEGLVLAAQKWDRPQWVGHKAANLHRAAKLGFKVPAFTLLSFEATKKMLEAGGDDLAEKLSELTATLGEHSVSSPLFLLRSSAIDEDRAGGSKAGTYASVSLSASDPLASVREFVERNGKQGYRGAIILQIYVAATVCGVSIDCDPRADATNKLIVEFVRGPRNTVTQGRGEPERLIYDHTFGEVVADATRGRAETLFEGFSPADLVEWLSSARRAFGEPTYTEWGFRAGELWLYQVRGD